MSSVRLIRYEVQLWAQWVVKQVPGRTGCALRNLLLPYRVGRGVTIWDNVHVDKPSKLVVGDNVSINRGCILSADGGITIGNDVLIGPNVIIYSQNHRFDGVSPTRSCGYERRPVLIEDNVWIAARVVVLPGVTIGRGSVIGAGSVVTRSVPPGTLVAGNPARKVRSIAP